MEIVDRGTGQPLVLIPGLQGRWPYVRPAVDALAECYRVITFSLCDEPTARASYDTERGLESFVEQVGTALDARGLAKAAICGISFGGLVALRFAARHPQRTSALVMVSTPGPVWHLKKRHDLYARLPWLFGPVFLAESPFRLRREIYMALPDGQQRRRFVWEQLRTVWEAPVSLSRMAARARLIGAADRLTDCAAISRPTLIVHGEPALDHVVNAGPTSDYARLIRGSRTAVIDRTGHLGSITRPDTFAALVRAFLTTSEQDTHHSAA